MPFAYYDRLSKSDRRVYDRSDAITQVRLEASAPLGDHLIDLSVALRESNRRRVEVHSREVLRALCEQLRVPPLKVKVLSVRPSAQWGELHGLYEPGEGKGWALITVWMRTAQRKQVVAYRTFLRTLLHELGHHLDYELYRLEESFHTQGFYKREASMFRQLEAMLPHELRYLGTKKPRPKQARLF